MTEPVETDDLADEIAEAISDTLDMDWQPSWAAPNIIAIINRVRREAADEIEVLRAELARVRKVGAQMAYTLGCIANEDWHGMTADDARREARAALEEWG